MMQKGNRVAIWIYDDAARLFLNLEDDEEVSQWVVIGTIVTEPDVLGVWLSIEKLEERRLHAPVRVWTVTPAVCLIRSNFIITAQLLTEEMQDTATIGFQPHP